MGNIVNWKRLFPILKKNNIIIIEDSADTICYRYETDLSDWSDVSNVVLLTI